MTTPTLATICDMDSAIRHCEIIEESAINDFRLSHGFSESDKVGEIFCAFYRIRDIRAATLALVDLCSVADHAKGRIPECWFDAGREAIAGLAETCRRDDAE